MKNFAIAFLLFTTVLGSSFGQTPNFALNDASTYPAERAFLDMGAEDYYSSYHTKNLIKVNPSFQPQTVAQVKQCATGSTTTTCITGDWNSYSPGNGLDFDPVTSNYLIGWTIYIACHGAQGSSPGTCSGGAQGQTSTVTANTANSGGSTTITFNALTTSVSAHDTLFLIRPLTLTTPSVEFTWGDFGWYPNNIAGSGTATIDTTSADFPPTLNGFANVVQVLELNAPNSSSTAGVGTYFDTAGNGPNYFISGSYHHCINAKVKSGSGTLVFSGNRPGGASWSSSVPISSTTWQQYCVTFTGSESSTTPAGSVNIFYTLITTGAADIVLIDATLTADADNSATAYSNQFISNVQTYNPGTVRYYDGNQFTAQTPLNWITPTAYRAPSGCSAAANGITPVGESLHDYLTMLQNLGYKRAAFTTSILWSSAQYQSLVEYLGGSSSTTMGGYRASLGQTAPWTTVFTDGIIMEMDNEPWNNSLCRGQYSFPLYSIGPNGYWNYAAIAEAACTAVHTAASYSSVIKCSAGVQTANSGTTSSIVTVDSSHNIDRIAANAYDSLTITSCTSPAPWVSSWVEKYNLTTSNDDLGMYTTQQTKGSWQSIYVYEYGNGTSGGSCTQANMNGYPEGEGYGLTNPLSKLYMQKSGFATEQGLWQMYQPTEPITTTAGAVTLNEWGCWTGPGGAYNNMRAACYGMKLMNDCISTGKSGYAVTPTNVATFNFTAANNVNATSNVPQLHGFAFTTGTNRCLYVSNIDPTNSYSFTASGTNAPTGTITRKLFTAPALTTSNEGANVSPNVTITSSTISPGTYTIPAHSSVTLSWSTAATETMNWMPIAPGGFSLIPNEQRDFYIQQTNYTTVGANFTITGGTIVSALNGMVTVRAPSSGTTCGYDSTNKVVTSSTNVVITATAKDGGASPVSLTVPVCNPPIQHDNVPAFRLGLYAGQSVNIQCMVIGSTNKTCSWAITTQPAGGNGSLGDTTQKDTVFTATVPGRYVVTSTASVDSSTSTTVIDIPSSRALPAPLTTNGTLPVNCDADSNLTGTTYHIGPSQTYTDFTAFFTAIAPGPGDTILYSNQGSAGSPTTLFNYFNTQAQGTQVQPVFFCGIPNSAGELPVIDGTDATSAYPANQFYTGSWLISFYKSGFGYYPSTDYPKFIQFSGFSLKNANNTLSYYVTGNSATRHNTWGQAPDGTNSGNVTCTGATCSDFIAAIRIQNGADINIIGNETSATGIGIFTEAKPVNQQMGYRPLIEGNNVHNYGLSTPASSAQTGTVHGLYIQSFEEVVQGNHIGPSASTHQGGTLKDRGVYQYIRYNYLDANDTSVRNLDMVDQQDAAYTTPNQFIANGDPVNDSLMTWDRLAGWQQSFYDDSWFYGNIQRTLSTYSPVHFSTDHGEYGTNRGEHLHYYNNTLYCMPGNTSGCAIADTTNDPDSDITPPIRVTANFATIDFLNTIGWIDNASQTGPAFLNYQRNRTGKATATSLYTPSTCCTNDQINGNTGGNNAGWAINATLGAGIDPLIYADYNNLPAHISGYGSSGGAVPNSVSTRPFNNTTFVSSAITGSVLPSGYSPVRSMWRPDLGYLTPRNVVVTTLTAGTIGAVDSPAAPTNLTVQISGKVRVSGRFVIR